MATFQTSKKPAFPPIEDEDALIHTRLANDERPLRRATHRFHGYVSTAYPSLGPSPSELTGSTSSLSVTDARDAFLLELSSYEMYLRKNRLICETERRQAKEYREESTRIANEREFLRGEIERLKIALEHAQVERRRKIEYDQIAERINTLPSRAEVEMSIAALVNDMQAIRAEHETQNQSIHARKAALDAIVSDLNALRLLGKEGSIPDAGDEATETDSATQPNANAGGSTSNVTNGSGNPKENDASESRASTPNTFNTSAKPFQPRSAISGAATPAGGSGATATGSTANLLLHAAIRNNASTLGVPSTSTPGASGTSTPSGTPRAVSPSAHTKYSSSTTATNAPGIRASDSAMDVEDGEEPEPLSQGDNGDRDYEMGEVQEEIAIPSSSKNSKVPFEDREEGETSDESSVLSDPPSED